MLDNFFICLNGIAPIFIMVLLGYFFKKIKLIDDAFVGKANNFVFKAALPCMLFYDISTTKIQEEFDFLLVGYAVAVTFLTFFASLALAQMFLKDPKQKASFAQGIFRSNYAILGIPLTNALFRPEVAVNAPVLLAICVPLFNVLAVILLTRFLSGVKGIRATLIGIAKNPIIIGAAMGVLASVLEINLPPVIIRPIQYMSQLCIPLALIVIGGSFVFSKAKQTVGLAVTASLIKTLMIPLIFIFPAYFLGITGEQLGVLYVFLAAPAAVSGYTMVRNMGGDVHMSGNIILLSTFFCFFTVFLGVMVMKGLALF